MIVLGVRKKLKYNVLLTIFKIKKGMIQKYLSGKVVYSFAGSHYAFVIDLCSTLKHYNLQYRVL